MPQQRTRGRFAAPAFAAVLALAAGPAAQADEAAEVSPKGLPLLALILKPVLAKVGDNLAEAAAERVGNSGLFARLLGKAQDKPAAVASAAPAAASMPLPAASGDVAPSIIYAVDRLDPRNYAVLEALEVARARPVLKTGDTFALRFATNLPGQVRIENVDSQGVRAPLGVYNVLPGQDNRIPRTRGIQLAGSTGLETFNLDFYPCLPPEAATLRGYAVYKDALPPCGSGAFEPPGVQVAMRGVVRTRAAVNLELDDPKMVVAALPDFKPRDIVHQSFTLQHDPR